MGLVVLWCVGSSWTRDRIHVPRIGRQILNHCTTREVPIHLLLYILLWLQRAPSIWTLAFVEFFLFIYLFWAVLGLCCCTRAFSSCGEQGLLFVVVCRLLIMVASLVAGTGSRRGGFSSCGTQAQ